MKNIKSMSSKTRVFLFLFLPLLVGIILFDSVLKYPNESRSFLYSVYIILSLILLISFIPLLVYKYLKQRKTNINSFWKFFCALWIAFVLFSIPLRVILFGLESIITLYDNSLFGYYTLSIIPTLIYYFIFIKLFYSFIAEFDKNMEDNRGYKSILIKFILLDSISSFIDLILLRVFDVDSDVYVQRLSMMNLEYFSDFFISSYFDIIIPCVIFFYSLYILYKDNTILSSDVRKLVSISGAVFISILLIQMVIPIVNAVPVRVSAGITKIILKVAIPLFILSLGGFSYFAKSSNKNPSNLTFCRKCGYHNKSGNIFCANCGSRI